MTFRSRYVTFPSYGRSRIIGSHLVDRLLGYGHQVTVLDDLSSGPKDNVHSKAQLVIGDILDRELVRKTVALQDGVFHLAAIPSVVKSTEEWTKTHMVNQTGALQIFEAAAFALKPVVYASSAAVYGESGSFPLSEGERLTPISPYGIDKLACELHASVGGAIYNLATIGLRFFNVYGPRQNPNSPYSGVISRFIERAKAGVPIVIYGNGQQTRDFIFVHDVVSRCISAMRVLQQRSTNLVVNVCTGEETTINKIAEIVNQLTGNKIQPSWRPARAGDIGRSVGDPRLGKALLGELSITPLAKGLVHTVCGERR